MNKTDYVNGWNDAVEQCEQDANKTLYHAKCLSRKTPDIITVDKINLQHLKKATHE